MNMSDIATPPAPKLSFSALIPPKTPASVLNKLKTSPGGFYAGTPRLAYRAEYFTGGRDGNILITKGLDYDEEFIIRGVFEISRNNFFFTPDGDFSPANIFHGRFTDLKLSCQLTAGRSKAFKFSSKDFSTVVNNLSAFENLVPKERHYETVSVIQDAIGQGRSIKLIHHLFEVSWYLVIRRSSLMVLNAIIYRPMTKLKVVLVTKMVTVQPLSVSYKRSFTVVRT
jgi:hypothetical protein